MIPRHPSTCAGQSGRTYATRGTYVVGLDTLIVQGLVWITRQQQQVKWAGVCFAGFVRRFLPPLPLSLSLSIFWVFRYGNDNYGYRYRSCFFLIVPKPFCFRYPTLGQTPTERKNSSVRIDLSDWFKVGQNQLKAWQSRKKQVCLGLFEPKLVTTPDWPIAGLLGYVLYQVLVFLECNWFWPKSGQVPLILAKTLKKARTHTTCSWTRIDQYEREQWSRHAFFRKGKYYSRSGTDMIIICSLSSFILIILRAISRPL